MKVRGFDFTWNIKTDCVNSKIFSCHLGQTKKKKRFNPKLNNKPRLRCLWVKSDLNDLCLMQHRRKKKTAVYMATPPPALTLANQNWRVVCCLFGGVFVRRCWRSDLLAGVTSHFPSLFESSTHPRCWRCRGGSKIGIEDEQEVVRCSTLFKMQFTNLFV